MGVESVRTNPIHRHIPPAICIERRSTGRGGDHHEKVAERTQFPEADLIGNHVNSIDLRPLFDRSTDGSPTPSRRARTERIQSDFAKLRAFETPRGALKKTAERTQFPARVGARAVVFVALAAFGLVFPIGARGGLAEEPQLEPALVVRVIHPDRQASAVIELFAGSKAAHPAAAMAAWRRATGRHDAIGKPLQAVAALFNPEMVPEWRSLHGARFALAADGEGDGLAWSFTAPNDDGAIAALIAAFRLSGGADDPPILDPPIAVKRLGESGSALASRVPEAAVFADRRDMLIAEIARLQAGEVDPNAPAPFGPEGSGLHLSLHPGLLAIDDQADSRIARFARAARAVGLTATEGTLGLNGDRLEIDLVSRFQADGAEVADASAPPALDPSWLAWFPERESAAAMAVVLGPGAEFWEGLFQVADAIDRADPARAELAPLRTRLNFLALARGVRLEADLWPLLHGASLGLLINEGTPDTLRGAVVALHAADPRSARRILDRVVAPFASMAGSAAPRPAAETGAEPDAEAPLIMFGRVSGRPLEAVARGSSVLVGWGEGALARALQSAEKPDESVAALLEGREPVSDGRPATRFGAVWPGRTASALGAWGPNSPFAAALADGSPMIWRGGWDSNRAWDAIRWPELRGLVARFLERIPQEPFEIP